MSCISPLPQPSASLQVGLSAGVCSAVLDESGGLCCTQSKLDELDSLALGQWQYAYTPACYAAYTRFRCAISCAADLNQWWDPVIERAHLCSDFCSDLWEHCWMANAPYATEAHLQSETAFCAFHSGPDRPVASTCLGHFGDSLSSAPRPPPGLGTGVLLAPHPPPSPPSPPPRPSPPPSRDDKGGSPTAIMLVILAVALVAVLYYFFGRRKRSPARQLASDHRTQRWQEELEHPQGTDALDEMDAKQMLGASSAPHAMGIAQPQAVMLDPEAAERARLHAELDAKLDRKKALEKKARVEQDLEIAASCQSSSPVLPNRNRQADHGASMSTNCGASHRAESADSTPRDMEQHVSVGKRVDDPFLNLMAQTSTKPTVAGHAKPDGKPSGRRSSKSGGCSRSANDACGRAGAASSHGSTQPDRAHARSHHRKIAAEMGARREERTRRKKEEAAQHVGGWANAHTSIYEQLASLAQLGPPLFPPQSWSLGEVTRGDLKQLRRAYHKAAARLHPDKVRELPDGAKALAEELFKALSDGYHKEVHRIEGRVAAQSV